MVKRYRCTDLISFPAGVGAVLAYNRTSQNAVLMPASDFELLNRCNTFKTLDEHAQSLASDLKHERLVADLSTHTAAAPVGRFLKRVRDFAQKQGVSFEDQSQSEILLEKLQEFAGAGLLISDAEMLPKRELPLEVEECIVTIGVLTHNRPELLARCLTSYIESCNKHGRVVDFVVVDDSDEQSVREENRRLLRSLKDKHYVQIMYAGLEEKKRYAEQLLAASDLPEDVVNFALFDVEDCGYTVGANRNALLLHTIGDLFFSVDDDTVAKLASTPEANSNQLHFFSESDPTDFWFYKNREAVLETIKIHDEDILSPHEKLLGKSVDRCINQTPEINFDQASPQFLRELQSNSGHVRITMTGLYGDSGMFSPSWQLRLTGDSYLRLTESQSTYDLAFNSREVFRAAKHTTISSGDFCMGYAIGVDNRTLLPPFFPVFRNEDGLFASTLKLCFDHAYIAHLPWAIMHVPQPRQYSEADRWEKPFLHTMYDAVFASLQSFSYPQGMMNAEDRLRALGQHLMNLGNSSLAAFEEFVRIYQWHVRSTNVGLLEAELANRKEAPEFWSRDVAKYIERLRRSLTDEVYKPPCDLLERRSVDEARTLTQRLIFNFGKLLYWWPEMIATAKTLHANGTRIASAID